MKLQSISTTLSTQPSMHDLDKLLNEKDDELEELQDSLEKSNLKIQGLEIENRGLEFDLDKAEQMLEEYFEKI